MALAPVWSPDQYTATNGVMQLLAYFNNNPARGTGTLPANEAGMNLLGVIPPHMLQYAKMFQMNLFGDYPTSTDVVPLAIFIGVFAIITILHFIIFCINMSRGHKFWLSLGWTFYGLMKVIGFAVRIVWLRDIGNVRKGISLEVFLILPAILLVSLNLILAQRLFTWRHPVGGSRRLFWNLMFVLYAVVLGVIAMTIMALAIPYLYYLTPEVYLRYQKVVQALSVLIVLYTLTAASLLALAYFFKPTLKDENLYTYQPWWIELFNPFYFVPKGAIHDAEQTFMKRGHYERRAVRVIASTHQNYRPVQGLSRQRGKVVHNVSVWMLLVSTVFIFVGAVLRCIVTFQARYQKDSGPATRPVAMYICWGLLETIVNLFYIIGRADLRFYRPDRLPRYVRQIITAEQSLANSRAQSVHSSYEEDLENVDKGGFDFQSPVPGEDWKYSRDDLDDASFDDDYLADYERRAKEVLESPPYPSHDDLTQIDSPPPPSQNRDPTHTGDHHYRTLRPRSRDSDEFQF